MESEGRRGVCGNFEMGDDGVTLYTEESGPVGRETSVFEGHGLIVAAKTLRYREVEKCTVAEISLRHWQRHFIH